MFKTAKRKIISLVLVGVVALGGAVYAATALTVGRASASTAATQATTAATGSQLRSTILDMLRDRMGLTGPEAEKFADQMLARMQNVDTGVDLQDMVDWCTRFSNADNANTSGRGMMNGTGPANGGRGMMNGTTAPGPAPSDPNDATPSAPGSQDSGSGLTPGGMMGTSGRGMMGTSGLR